MITTKTQASGRRPKAAGKQRQRTLLPDPRKFTLKLAPEEIALARSLERVIAQPGQRLTLQDVVRIGLANLGLLHRSKLEAGTDLT